MKARLQTQTKAAPPLSPAPVHTNLLQRKCACGEAAGMTGECENCRSKHLTLQRQATSKAELSSVPPIVHEALRSPGQPLDQATRDFIEPRFGHDFSHVRVHNDAKAADSARTVNALAYTVGDNVVFGANQYAPTTFRGRGLLGHELAHTIQQRNAAASPPSADSNGAFEASAEAAGRDISIGRSVSRDLPSCGVGLSRSPDTEREEAEKEALEFLARAEEEEKKEKEEKEKGEEAAASRYKTESLIGRYKIPGAFNEEESDKEYNENSKRIDEQISEERKIAKRPYKNRLHHARSIAQSKSDKWYSAKEANAQMTGEDVWREGIANDLFLESEKKFVYEDQGSIQAYYQEKIEEDAKQARRKFEIDQYNKHVAQGKQLSSPAPFIQPFAYAAAGPLVGAAYAGSQTGLTVGEVYNACTNGTGTECAAATVKGAATTAAVKVATRGKPGAGVRDQPPPPPSRGTTIKASPPPPPGGPPTRTIKASPPPPPVRQTVTNRPTSTTATKSPPTVVSQNPPPPVKEPMKNEDPPAIPARNPPKSQTTPKALPRAKRPKPQKPTTDPPAKKPTSKKAEKDAKYADNLDKRIAKARNELMEAEQRTVEYKDARASAGEKQKGGPSKIIWNKKEEIYVLVRAKTYPDRTILEQVQFVGVKGKDGKIKPSAEIAGEGRTLDFLEVKGAKVLGGEVKSKAEMVHSVENLQKPGMEGDFKPTTSKVGLQRGKEKSIIDEANAQGGNLVFKGKDVRTGVDFTIEVDPKDYQSTVVSYDQIMPN